VGIYRDLGRNPGVYRVLASQLTARFPFGMLSIIILLHVQQGYGDYTSAGLVLAAQSVGQAASGPLSGRLMGHLGMRPVLGATSIVCAALLLAIAFTRPPLIAVMALALLVGLSTPPVTSAVRTVYPSMVPGKQLSALFSLDAAAQEIIWVFGPVVAVIASSQLGTAFGLSLAAGFLVVGGAWFILSPTLGQIRIPRPKRRFGAVLRYPTVIISTVVGFFFIASFAAIEAGIVAAFSDGSGHGHSSLEAGIVLAVFAAGSLVGGLLMGHRELRPWSLALRLLIVLVGTLACLVSLNIWWMSAVLFLGGLGTAPALAAISNVVAATVRFSETAEAYGWVNTGQLVGVASGSALAGIMIDGFGARGAIVASAALLLVAVIAAFASVRWLPDLKGRVIEPPPETGTLAIPLP